MSLCSLLCTQPKFMHPRCSEKKDELLSNCIEFILQLVQLIKFSPKRLLFQNIQQQIRFGDDSAAVPSSLRPLCPTRWTVRHSAIDEVLNNYKAFMSCLQQIEEGHDEYAAKARGLLIQMESFELYFSLKLSFVVFAAAEQLSIDLQAKDTTAGEGLKGAHLLQAHVSILRSDSKFSAFYEDVLQSSQELTDESFLIESAKGQHTLCPELHQILEKYHIDIDRLYIQSAMLADTINTAFGGSIKTVTNVRTIADALNQSTIVRGMLNEVDKLVQVYLTYPVTSATAERSFSSLRRIKTFLRSSMTAQRLNNLFILYVHSHLLTNLI